MDPIPEQPTDIDTDTVSFDDGTAAHRYVVPGLDRVIHEAYEPMVGHGHMAVLSGGRSYGEIPSAPDGRAAARPPLTRGRAALVREQRAGCQERAYAVIERAFPYTRGGVRSSGRIKTTRACPRRRGAHPRRAPSPDNTIRRQGATTPRGPRRPSGQNRPAGDERDGEWPMSEARGATEGVEPDKIARRRGDGLSSVRL